MSGTGKKPAPSRRPERPVSSKAKHGGNQKRCIPQERFPAVKDLDAKRREALRELAALDQELGLR